jgi:glycosyltransferase involved in cell wall biosynthesis
LIRLGAYSAGYKNLPQHRKDIKSKIEGDVEFYPVSRSYEKLSLLIAVTILLFRFFQYRKKDAIVIHARGAFSGKVAAVMKKFYKNIKFLYDIRGDVAAEYKYHALNTGVSEEEIERKLNKDFKYQKYVTDHADHFNCVSHVLKSRVLKSYEIPPENVNVVPCLADHKKFYFDEKIRSENRRLMGFDNKFVFIYSGGVGAWHCTDKVFELMSRLLPMNEKNYFVMLTPALHEAKTLAEKFLREGTYSIRSVPHDQVPLYLMSSDMGILLRENHPLNQVAAPTKFAEYLMSGLPLIISENIGDYSNFVRDRKLGIVVDNNASVDDIIKRYDYFWRHNSRPSKKEISEIGFENFSKVKFAKIIHNTYSNL